MTKWTAETAAAAAAAATSLYLSASRVNPMICQNHVSLSNSVSHCRINMPIIDYRGAASSSGSEHNTLHHEQGDAEREREREEKSERKRSRVTQW